ncbi:MAG: membrane-associated protein [Myxococcota bacterium]|nr:membrane-associated protein [Myxococcota bacterium]
MRGHRQIPLGIKVLYGLFLCVLVPTYWRHYGPGNFLWASDIALFLVFLSVLSERPLLNSMMAIGVLPFEIVWILDFGSGARLLGMASYMFETERPLYLRGLSLFHVALPVVTIFLLHRLGYDRRALAAQTLLAWIVLPLTYFATEPAANVNLVFGFGKEPQNVMHPLLHLALEMLLVPCVVFWPAHLLLRRLFGRRRP